MTDFEEFLEQLAQHEEERNRKEMSTRERILMHAGVRLNWMGDFLANPNIEYVLQEIPLERVRMNGSEPEWNPILLEQCNGSIPAFQKLLASHPALKPQFMKHASFGDEPVLLIGPQEEGLYAPFDGMHRIVGAAIEGRKNIQAFVAQNEQEYLPVCEPHVVYDLIRAYQRNARDEQGQEQLYNALLLLIRTYSNVGEVLEKRFGPDRLNDADVQGIIQRVLEKSDV